MTASRPKQGIGSFLVDHFHYHLSLLVDRERLRLIRYALLEIIGRPIYLTHTPL